MNQHHPLILASSSVKRLALLASIGIIPEQIIAANIDETRLKREKLDKLVARLSQEKALAVAANINSNAFILGADTIVSTKARIFEKATSDEEVIAHLKFFSGRKIQVQTAVSLAKIEDGKLVKISTKLSLTKIKFKHISSQELDLYLKTKAGIGCAGGFNIQGFGETLLQGVWGSYSGVVGLPLHETVNLLNGLGYDYFKSKS